MLSLKSYCICQKRW